MEKKLSKKKQVLAEVPLSKAFSDAHDSKLNRQLNLIRYKIAVEYDGTNYVGFQKQNDPKQKSVEGVLGEAVFKLSQEKVEIIASGRTDAGVHALEQIVHFDLSKIFQPHQIIFGLNNYLVGEDIIVKSCQLVDENFHARFSAKKRHYRYLIINRPTQLALQKKRAWCVVKNLDIEEMKKAAGFLIGHHDFSAFRDAECQAKSALRTLDEISIRKNGEEITIEVSALSFLHHMVRNIVGTLVWVGNGKISADEVKNILASRDRRKSGPNAPAHGLYFVGTDY